MPVELKRMRELMLPGLRQVSMGPQTIAMWDEVFEKGAIISLPVPMVSLQAAAALGLTAAVIRNPTVTRRFFSWGTQKDDQPQSP